MCWFQAHNGSQRMQTTCFKTKCFVCHNKVGLVCETTDVTIEGNDQVICYRCNYFYEIRMIELAMNGVVV